MARRRPRSGAVRHPGRQRRPVPLPLQAAALGLPSTDTPLDRLVRLLVAFAFEGKYFTLFSVLFGIGLAMQLDGARPVTRVVRRLLVLTGIGALHATFLWWGDILAFYGVVGIGWAGGYGLTVATCALQVPLSRWWLARFRYGPVEAGWRAATYGRWPRWRGP